MDGSLGGKVALVTGGGRGIGRGIALVLAQDGADVAIGELDREAAEQVAGEIGRLGRRSVAIQADVSARAGAEALVEAALRSLGRIDILVNNAGVMGASGWKERPSPSDEDWQAALQVNMMSHVFCSEAVAPHMKECGSGKIVNISSIGGLGGSRDSPHYSASKAADINFTQSLALQLGRYGINVNAILPGPTVTDMAWGVQGQIRLRRPRWASVSDEEMWRTAASRTPLGRGNTPEDIGYLASFLVSDRARNITGQAIAVDSGMRMR